MRTFDFSAIKGPLGRSISAGGRSVLYFGGTAYLGIPRQPKFLDYYLEGLHHFGLNNGTSRNNNVQLGIYKEAEQAAALRFGAESGLLTSSGFLAAQMTVRHFADWGQLEYAPGSHPALWLKGKPDVSGSFEDWGLALVNRINRSPQKRWVVVSNSMNNLFPERYDFSFLEGVVREKELILIVDDSHGIGVLNNGRGCYPVLPSQEHVKRIVVASMAKALGVDAGLVLGPEILVGELKNTEAFLGASPPSAAGLFAFMQAEDIYRTELERLLELCAHFKAGLKDLKSDFAFLEGFPVYLSANKNLAQQLMEKQVLISSFAYPDQFGEVLNRIVLCSWHSKSDLDNLLNILVSCA
ncbi:aminotransferase class I/II [Pedobacter sp. HMWF019]|uniref:aminotransferase class I/II-fold pyridoxal phosphate-dependent enzyme n=1 Tax=Pedobacter sp. HMWF019 TaxID=2056856 RepID=UPI000D352D64|nr:aminotransferase class I/II-fold pyridoxal phosphate-dependent enzyme [Pedobacter sp. HMWF019]PTS93956.1 aminotransferase class I/II [Pedobacter sp. HMWF019]